MPAERSRVCNVRRASDDTLLQLILFFGVLSAFLGAKVAVQGDELAPFRRANAAPPSGV